MTVDPVEFRDAMSRIPAPVAVVTTIDAHGDPYGFTASSLCALSLTPPLVLVCLDRHMRCHMAFVTGTMFTINILAEDQHDLARLFATRGADKFADPRVSRERGVPAVVAGAVLVVACRTYATHEGGDHTILVGEVTATAPGTGQPLIHVNRRFAVPAAISAPRADLRAINELRAG